MISDPVRSPADADTSIDVKQAWALRYWTQELGVSERELRETVEAVGPLLADVKKILAR